MTASTSPGRLHATLLLAGVTWGLVASGTAAAAPGLGPETVEDATSGAPEVVAWERVLPEAAPGELAEALPKGARLLPARAGELLRLRGAVRPTVGRMWRTGLAVAYLDESDLLVEDPQGGWRFVAPLGGHDAVVLAATAPLTVETARARDVGYAWEVYEGELVRWADHRRAGELPPSPPSATAEAAWLTTAGATALLDAAGALDAGGRHLGAVLALEAVAATRPRVSPYFRPLDGGLAPGRVTPGKPRTLTVHGPAYLELTARAAAAGGARPAVRFAMDGRPHGGALGDAGGRLPASARRGRGPLVGDGDDAPVGDAARLTWLLRVPPGAHTLVITATDAPAFVVGRVFRKRFHARNALRHDESIEGRLAAAAATAARHPGVLEALVVAETRRQAGRLDEAALAFVPLVSSKQPPAIRAFAAWRLAELTVDPDDADRLFGFAETAVAELPASVRRVAAPALARARALRSIADDRPQRAAATVAAHPALWLESRLAAALVGQDGDSGAGVARTAAVLARAPLGAARSLRRAFLDGTVWSSSPGSLGDDAVAVLSRDRLGPCREPTLAGTLAESAGDSVWRLSSRAVTVDIPADPLGAGRFRVVRVLALSGDEPALDAAVADAHEGGPELALPTPTVRAMEEHRLALAPGRHVLRARGGALLFVVPPTELDPTDAQSRCPRYRRRAFAPVGSEGRTFGVGASAGALVGLELRTLGAAEEVVSATVEVDGRRRPLRYRAMRDETALAAARTTPVGSAVVIDLVAADPRSLRLVPSTRAKATLLARPLVRTTPAVRSPAPSLLALDGGPSTVTVTLALQAFGDDPLVALRRLGGALAKATTPEERAQLRTARAALLARLNRLGYAEEDLLAAAAEPTPSASLLAYLLREGERYVDPIVGVGGYPLDPTAPILHRLRDDVETRSLAREARGGNAESARTLLGERRNGGPSPTAGAVALVARFDDVVGDAHGAAAAYGALARAFPDDRRLFAAEASRRLDGGGSATRALVAALVAGDAPGAADARARALRATRWRSIQHAQAAAGSWVPADLTRLPAPTRDELRAALVAPDADAADFLWLEPGLMGRAVLVVPAGGVVVRTDARCVELRPHAAQARGAGAGCHLSVRVDGETLADLGPKAAGFSLAAGVHTVEVVLAPGGVDVVAAVRLLSDGPVEGARLLASTKPDEHVFVVTPRREDRRFLAEPDAPVVLDVLGPTALRLEALAEPGPPVTLTLRDLGTATRAKGGPAPAPALALLELDSGGAGELVVPLTEERRYRVELRPSIGRVAVSAQVREDRSATPLVSRAAARPAPLPLAEPGAVPEAPALALREVNALDGPGTVTATTFFRDGAVGERDTTTDQGGRYAELAVAWRRRTGDVWWLAEAFGRLRPVGTPSGGLGARARWAFAGPLRLDAGVAGITQDTEASTLVTAWLDASLTARLWLGDDWFLVPSVGTQGRIGVQDDPGGDGVDPDVWSPFDAAHDRALFGALRLDWEPFLDLRVHGRARAVTNAGFGTIDRTAALVGVDGALARLSYHGALELERRFADLDRPETQTRFIAGVGAAYGLWFRGQDRLSIFATAAVSPGDQASGLVGLAYDWTFGRGLRDYAPIELLFGNQLGPWDEARQQHPVEERTP